MAKVLVKIAPTFTLDKIDIDDIEKKYNEGYYKTKKIPKIKLSTHNITAFQKKDNIVDQYDTYISKDVFGVKTQICTTNCNSFQGNDGGRCFYCRRDFTHKSIGYVTKIHKINNIITFYTSDIFCRFSCIMASLDEIKINERYKSLYVTDTMHLFGLLYPNVQLENSNNFRLLKCNGGSLTDEEWDVDNYVYKHIDGIDIIPTKQQFIQTKR